MVYVMLTDLILYPPHYLLQTVQLQSNHRCCFPHQLAKSAGLSLDATSQAHRHKGQHTDDKELVAHKRSEEACLAPNISVCGTSPILLIVYFICSEILLMFPVTNYKYYTGYSVMRLVILLCQCVSSNLLLSMAEMELVGLTAYRDGLFLHNCSPPKGHEINLRGYEIINGERERERERESQREGTKFIHKAVFNFCIFL